VLNGGHKFLVEADVVQRQQDRAEYFADLEEVSYGGGGYGVVATNAMTSRPRFAVRSGWWVGFVYELKGVELAVLHFEHQTDGPTGQFSEIALAVPDAIGTGPTGVNRRGFEVRRNVPPERPVDSFARSRCATFRQ